MVNSKDNSTVSLSPKQTFGHATVPFQKGSPTAPPAREELYMELNRKEQEIQNLMKMIRVLKKSGTTNTMDSSASKELIHGAIKHHQKKGSSHFMLVQDKDNDYVDGDENTEELLGDEYEDEIDENDAS